MNSKRKAELQRKLTLSSVPKPPAGLLDRIKGDIPEYLRPEADRVRMRRSVAFNMRVAASLLLVVSAVVTTLYLLEPQEQLAKMAESAVPMPARVPINDQRAAAPRTDELRVEITQAAPASSSDTVLQVANVGSQSAPEAKVAGGVERRGGRDEGVVYGVVGGVAGGVAGGTVGGVVGGSASTATFAYDAREEIAATAEAPRIAAAEPAPAPAPVTAMADAASAPAAPAPPRATARLAAPSLIREAHAADLDLGPRASVFGISVDPTVFQKIKETLEDNERPSASAVNLEAIINYFAGGPVRKVRRGVKLEVEGSPSPVGGIGQRGFLRFTIDTASSDSRLPVAANAKLEIDLNGKVVESAVPVGDSVVTGPENALLHDLSVTGLYEVSLKPNLRASDRVATVRLTYDDVADRKTRTIEKIVYARDFGKLWARSSRRHRLASLGAVWGQSLRSTSPAPEVARRAEELATQDPHDARAQELATAATASTKLSNSGF